MVDVDPDDGDGVWEVASGVDALYLSGHREAPAWLIAKLNLLRTRAAEESMPQPYEFGGYRFMVHPRGWGPYTYLLTHPFGRIGVTASSQFPAFRVQPLTIALHGLGAAATFEWFRDVISTEVDDVRFTVSRLDLYCDVQGWVPTAESRHEVVCRSRSVVLYEISAELTGMEFGRRKTGGVLLRTYDKTRQVFEMGLDYWYPIWEDRFDPTLPVWRFEFEFGRSGLLSYGIDTPEETLEAVDGLWAAATSHLYRFTTPTDDNTPTRWPISPEWAVIQNASLRSDAVPIDRLIEAKKQGTVRKLMPLLNGVLSSFGALTGCTTLNEVLEALPEHIGNYETWTSVSFVDRIEAKVRA